MYDVHIANYNYRDKNRITKTNCKYTINSSYIQKYINIKHLIISFKIKFRAVK